MKKKLLVLAVILVLAFVFAALYIFVLGKPSYLKTDLPFEKADGKLLGIIQIGGSKEDYDYSIADKYFKTTDFETIEFGGTEKYLIIPRNNEIEVYSLNMDEDCLINETYIKTMTQPFYITCNVSDIISNSLLRVMVDGKQYSYSPYINLKDGSLVVENFVLHINN
ncbi:MAG: hypothetical protein IJ272_09700 [Clostridia bacterium]|nr:hypothetical protein [Clostridia bacterium]